METPDFDASGKFDGQADQTGSAALRRFRPAISAAIEFAERRPAALRSRVLSGRITRTEGPYLSSGEWWDDRRWCREEWDVQIDHRACGRIVRSNDGCFLEGLYD